MIQFRKLSTEMSQELSTEKFQRLSMTMYFSTEGFSMSILATQTTMIALTTKIRTPTTPRSNSVLDSDFPQTTLRNSTTETLSVMDLPPTTALTKHPSPPIFPVVIPSSIPIATTTVREDKESMSLLLISPVDSSALNLPTTTITKTATHPNHLAAILTHALMLSLSSIMALVMETPQDASAETLQERFTKELLEVTATPVMTTMSQSTYTITDTPMLDKNQEQSMLMRHTLSSIRFHTLSTGQSPEKSLCQKTILLTSRCQSLPTWTFHTLTTKRERLSKMSKELLIASATTTEQ